MNILGHTISGVMVAAAASGPLGVEICDCDRESENWRQTEGGEEEVLLALRI